MHRILIADDHPLFRAALAMAIAGLGEAEVEEADGLRQTLAALEAGPAFDLLLLDLLMPGSRGLAGLARIRAEFPAVAVVVISANEDPLVIRRALEHGAAGFIPKSAGLAQLTEAIGCVLDCGTWIPPHLRERVESARDPEDDLATRIARLTPQQLKVLEMVAEGRLNKQIADRLGIQERTVKAHMSEIFAKLEVRNRTQAGIAFRSLELSDPVVVRDESTDPASE